jgi:hypothetical protein
VQELFRKNTVENCACLCKKFSKKTGHTFPLIHNMADVLRAKKIND